MKSAICIFAGVRAAIIVTNKTSKNNILNGFVCVSDGY
jgi:hypothetical protein